MKKTFTDYEKILNEHFKDIKEDEIYFFCTTPISDQGWSLEERERTLKRVDYLLSLNDKNAYTYLWNTTTKRHIDKIDLNEIKKYGTNRVYEFYNKRIDAAKNSDINTRGFGNKDIIGEKVFLTTATKADKLLIEKHFKEDGDYLKFANSIPNNKNIQDTIDYVYCVGSINNPPKISFVIKDKTTKQTVGFVGCHAELMNTSYEIAYYVFKDCRKKGYALDAVKIFVDAVLKGKLYYPVYCELDNVILRKKFKCDLLRCIPNEDNEASNKLAQSAGFQFVGKDYYSRISPVTHEHFSANVYIIKNK